MTKYSDSATLNFCRSVLSNARAVLFTWPRPHQYISANTHARTTRNIAAMLAARRPYSLIFDGGNSRRAVFSEYASWRQFTFSTASIKLRLFVSTHAGDTALIPMVPRRSPDPVGGRPFHGACLTSRCTTMP